MVSENYIKKTHTNIIKGVALIFMFVHHFFTFPERIVCGVNYENIEVFSIYFHDALKICVPIFAFLTGYFYFFNKNKNYRYSFKKSTDLYINYLVIFALMLVTDFLLQCYEFGIKDVILELLLLRTPNMEFCWYVLFFIFVMFCMPLFAKIADKNSVIAFSVGVVLPTVIIYILNCLGEVETFRRFDTVFDVIKYISWFPSVASGYIFAKDNLFQKMHECNVKSKFVTIVMCFAYMLLPFVARNQSASFDFIYAPLFIFGLVEIIDMIPNIKVLLPLSIIGKYSLLMWFIHSIFFNVSKEFTQPILYYPHNAILVTLWGLIMCLLASVILTYPINVLIKLKNKIFRL